MYALFALVSTVLTSFLPILDKYLLRDTRPALFKLSALFTILWAQLFLGEGHRRQRLLGAGVMLLGGALVANIT